MRKLASIQKIWKIDPIEDADRIELAHVLGWQCVVNKGQFSEMDNAVYFEVDSFLPIRPGSSCDSIPGDPGRCRRRHGCK